MSRSSKSPTRVSASRGFRLVRARSTAVAVAGVLAVSATAASIVSAQAKPPSGGSGKDCSTTDRGRVLATTAIARLNRTQVSQELEAGGLPSQTRYGVAAYRILYCTISPAGRPTTGSGLLALPQHKTSPLPLVGYEHSTVAQKDHAPSFLVLPETRLIPLFFASDGYAVAAPDYLGLGLSPGLHPFVHAASETTASLDMLTAATKVTAERGVRLSRELFLTGFSQGGHSVMATGRALQRRPGRWRVAALAPIAGPYDLAGAEFPAMFDPTRVDPHHASAYLAYILTAWNRLYHLYSDPGQVYTAPYAGKIESLFDGTHEFDDIAALLPAPQELFQPAWRAMIHHPTGRFAAALRANLVCQWSPRTPTRLYAAHGDRDVVFANAERCRDQIQAHGGQAKIVDMGNVDHVGTAITSIPQVRTWFTQLLGP